MYSTTALMVRLEALIREVWMRGYDGRFQLKMGLEDALASAEYMTRPAREHKASGDTMLKAMLLVEDAWKGAMARLFLDDHERQDVHRQFSRWLDDAAAEQPEETMGYWPVMATKLMRAA